MCHKYLVSEQSMYDLCVLSAGKTAEECAGRNGGNTGWSHQ
uniref:Uncharacterized protein n=1 Tax=Anguilla anguilla TaxID=7936 RepID=A0A0E9TZ86_ANGAN